MDSLMEKSDMRKALSEAEWQQFEKEGYARLGKLVADDELSALQRRIDDIMMGTAAVPYDRMMLQLDTTTGEYKDMSKQTLGHKGATLAYRKMQGLKLDPLFLQYMQQRLFLDICTRAYGPDIPITITRAMFMNKPARQGTKLPWHQDYFSHVDPSPTITVWMAMDESIIANGCVKILPGSHQHFPDEERFSFLNEEQVAEVLEKYQPTTLECDAGDGILLHNRLLHSSEVNSTDRPRRAFSVCYVDGRAKNRDGSDLSLPLIFGEGALRPEEVGTALVA